MKKIKTLILKVLLCPDLHLSKISQLTLIFQKGSLVRKNVHSAQVGTNHFHGCIMILKKMCCVAHVSQEKKGNLALSSEKEDAFLSTGCSNWKKALEKFRKHESSHCHLEASTMSVIRETHEDIGEIFSDTLSLEKFKNRQIFLKILENVRFLCRQGQPLRSNEKEGNFDQLLLHSAKTDSRTTEWLKKKSGKYTYPSIQNEFIKTMALSILRDIASNVHKGVFYTIMADEVTDSSNQEQFIFFLRCVDVGLNPHEEFIGLHVVPNICADTLVACSRDVFNSYELSTQKLQRPVF